MGYSSRSFPWYYPGWVYFNILRYYPGQGYFGILRYYPGQGYFGILRYYPGQGYFGVSFGTAVGPVLEQQILNTIVNNQNSEGILL